MAVRSKNVRVVRRRRASPTGRAESSGYTWERTRATIGIFLFLAAFAWVWCVDGDWTARFIVAVRHTSYETGWAGHLIISAVEMLPVFVVPFVPIPQRNKARLLLLVLVLPFGLVNVLSSAIGVQQDLLGNRYVFEWNALATALASLTAHAPERVFVYLITLLWYVWRGKYE